MSAPRTSAGVAARTAVSHVHTPARTAGNAASAGAFDHQGVVAPSGARTLHAQVTGQVHLHRVTSVF